MVATHPPSPSITQKRGAYAATLIQSVAFGLYLVIATRCLRLQLRHRTRNHRVFLGYTCTMLAVVITWYSTAVITDAQVQLDGLNTSCSPLGITRQLLGSIMLWAADSLLLWRLFIIWDGNKFICILPGLIFLSSLAMGLVTNFSCIILSSQPPSGTIKLVAAHRFSAPFIALSISLNLTATALISLRLLYTRHQARQAGLTEHSGTYTSLVGVLIESAAIYTGAGVLFLPFLVDVKLAALSQAPSTVFIVAAFIAPALIQLRIAKGTAYSRSRTVQTTATEDTAFSVQLDTVLAGTRSGGPWQVSHVQTHQSRDADLWGQK